MLLRVDAHTLAAREHELGLEEVVDAQPELACQVADAAAEREPPDPGGRDDSARSCQAVLAGGLVDLPPRAPAAHPNGARVGVNLDFFQQREVDHHSAVARAQPGAVVAAAADRDQQVMIAGERDRPRHVSEARAACDQGGPLVDHRVVDRARLRVVGVFGADQAAFESCELVAGKLGRCRHRAHASPLSVGFRSLGVTTRGTVVTPGNCCDSEPPARRQLARRCV